MNWAVYGALRSWVALIGGKITHLVQERQLQAVRSRIRALRYGLDQVSGEIGTLQVRAIPLERQVKAYKARELYEHQYKPPRKEVERREKVWAHLQGLTRNVKRLEGRKERIESELAELEA